MTDFPANSRSSRQVVSVVVAVHGNVAAVSGLVTAIEDQDFSTDRVELVVVDNHAIRSVPGALLEGASVAHVLVHEPRPGLSRARNTGIRAAHGEFILITDPDSRPSGQWVRQLVAALERTGAYCAGGRVLARFTGGATPSLDPAVLQLFVPLAWPDHVARLTSPYWLVGCNLAARRDPLPQFDERLGARPGRHLSCEDLEFVFRAERNGLPVVVAPDAVVHRAIHPADLRVTAVLGRALWHGVSMARMVALHPDAEVYDSYRLRDALASITPTRVLPGLAGVARIVGLRTETLRLAVPGHRLARMSSPVPGGAR